MIGSSELLHSALKSVLNDESFKVHSPLAESATHIASLLMAYCTDPLNPSILFSKFSEDLTCQLRKCFVTKTSHKMEKEAMWGHYHVLWSSTNLITSWVDFVFEAVGERPTPAFFQYITHEVRHKTKNCIIIVKFNLA